jgi:Ca-activated chloride channel family protein
VPIAAIAAYLVVQRARQRRVLRFANMELLERVAPQRSNRFRHLPAILTALCLVLLSIALAGPTHAVQIPRNRAVVMLVIDVSQSMRSTDDETMRKVAELSGGTAYTASTTAELNDIYATLQQQIGYETRCWTVGRTAATARRWCRRSR